MTYQITLSNGSVLTNIQDNTLDNTTSLTLVGQNYLNYGTQIADNFVRLLENAANSVAPQNPLVGQLWFDTAHSQMKVWTGQTWYALIAGVTSVVTKTGDVTFTQLVSAGLAPLASPLLTGIPQAPTAPTGTSNNQIASTAFVQNSLAGLQTGVISVIGYTGVVTLQQLITGGLAPTESPTLTGIPRVPTAPVGTATTQAASTAFVLNEVASLSTGVISVVGYNGVVTLSQLVNGGVAPLQSPTLTGVPQCPTAAPGTSNNQIASTAFVTNAFNSLPSAPVPPKTRITAPLNLYVSTTGNDANDGLTVSTAFRTVQKAWNVILYNYDLNGYQVTVQIADGSYTGAVCSGCPVGAALIANLTTQPYNFGSSYGCPSPVKFTSSSGNASRCIISTSNTSGFLASFGAQIDVVNITLTASGAAQGANTNGTALIAQTGGYIGAYNCVFGQCGNSHMEAYGGLIGVANNTISGGASCCMYATRQGHINANYMTLTLQNSPQFGWAFATAEHNGLIEIGACTFNGSARGSRYAAQLGGLVLGQGNSDPNYLPGDAAGNADGSTFGVYR